MTIELSANIVRGVSAYLNLALERKVALALKVALAQKGALVRFAALSCQGICRRDEVSSVTTDYKGRPSNNFSYIR